MADVTIISGSTLGSGEYVAKHVAGELAGESSAMLEKLTAQAPSLSKVTFGQ